MILAPARSSIALSDFRRTIPYETQIAARRFGSGRTQGERFALPRGGQVEIDHLIADVDGTRHLVLHDVEAEAAIEGDHCVRILHGKGDVVEATHLACLLSGDLSR